MLKQLVRLDANNAVDCHLALESVVVTNGVLTHEDGSPVAEWPGKWIDVTDLAELPQAGATFANGAFTAPQPPVQKIDLPALAADARYAKETGGITVDGTLVGTDRGSQAMLTGAYNNATRDPSWSTVWKTSGGFVTLTAAQIVAISVAVSMHVETCFKKEKDVCDQIAAGTITTTDQVAAAFASVPTTYTV